MSTPPMQPSHVSSSIVPRDPVGLDPYAHLTSGIVGCLPHNLPGLFASAVTSICVVAPALAAQGSARLRSFVRTGGLYMPDSSSNQMGQRLQRVHGDIERALSVAYDVLPAVPGDVRQALGCDPSTLPFMVSSFSDLTSFSQWVGLVWIQSILDAMLQQPGCSALGFRVVKIYGQQGEPNSARYYPIVMTLGLDADSYAIAELRKEMLGYGRVMLKKSSPGNRPTFTMTPITNLSQRERVIDLRAHLPGSGALLYPPPAMPGDMAAHLLGLPQRLFEE